MTDYNFDYYKKYYDKELINFWQNLKIGHDAFQKHKKELTIKIDKDGNYIFNLISPTTLPTIDILSYCIGG